MTPKKRDDVAPSKSRDLSEYHAKRKAGATPVPVRWDLPDWEREQLREVIAARVELGDDDLPWIRGTADDPVPELDDVVAALLQDERSRQLQAG